MYQACHRAHDIFDRHRGVYPMLKEKVYAVSSETTQRTFYRRSYAVGPTVQAGVDAVLYPVAELRGQNDTIALAHECARQEFFVRIRTIDLGGVEQGYAEFHRPVNRRNGFGVIAILALAVGLAHSHATESESGNGESRGSERARWQHGVHC